MDGDHVSLRGRYPWLTPDPAVALICWPEGEGERRQLAATGCPRVLVVAPDASPPVTWDAIEDWVREPIDPAELRARVAHLRLRHSSVPPSVHLDDNGVCQVGGRRVVVSELERAILALLVERIGQPVARPVLREAYIAAGGTSGGLTRAVSRLRQRLGPVGLDVHAMSARALMLERQPPPLREPVAAYGGWSQKL